MADYLGFKDSWIKTCGEYSETTPTTKKIWNLAMLYATHGDQHNTVIGPNQRMHRCGWSIEALFESKIKPSTGMVTGPGNMPYKKLVAMGLKSSTHIDMKEYFQINVESILSGKSPSRSFDETSRVEISYISNTVNLVKDNLEETRNLSK